MIFCLRALYLTFLGKTGYRENLNDSMLFVQKPDEFVHHYSDTPGPPRVIFLSELQQGHGPMGFVMSNGEKIGEWMHWLPFIKYARNSNGGQALRVFEITAERPWIKNEMLMSTSPAYSIFYDDGQKAYLDISRLRHYKRPNQFRCMIVVLPYDNERIIYVLQQHQYREVTHCF